MPPKRTTTPSISRKRAPSVDLNPTSSKRNRSKPKASPHKQASITFGPDNDQSGHHEPRHREGSPAKGALRQGSIARSDDSGPDDDTDVSVPEEEIDSDVEMRELRQNYERDVAELNARRRRGRQGCRIRRVDYVGGRDFLGSQSVSLTETEPTRPDVFGDGIRGMHREAFGSTTTTAGGRSGTLGGQGGVSAAVPRADGRKATTSTQSSGHPLGGDLPGLSFTEGIKNREGALASIFATKGSFKGFDKDEVLAHNVRWLVGGVVDYAHKYYNSSIPPNRRRAFFDGLLKKENHHLIRYLGCLAIAGAQGEQSWVD